LCAASAEREMSVPRRKTKGVDTRPLFKGKVSSAVDRAPIAAGV
jgi:hypothetical protein